MTVRTVYSRTEPSLPGLRVLGVVTWADSWPEWVLEEVVERKPKERTKRKHDGRLRKQVYQYVSKERH